MPLFPSLMSKNFRTLLLFSIPLISFLYLDVMSRCVDKHVCVWWGRGKARLDKRHWGEEEEAYLDLQVEDFMVQ